MQLPFREISRWCQAYLELQYSNEVGRHFSQLLNELGEIANIPQDGVDRFDWLKAREAEVARQLTLLSDAIAAHLELQRQRHATREIAQTDGTKTKTLLFVYGTLKTGHRRSVALLNERMLGVARTLPHYRMYNCGGYPGLVQDPQGLAIEGELWEISGECLQSLDEIEGVHLNLYRRKPIRLDEPYRDQDVQSYFYCRDIQGLVDCGTCWLDENR